MNANDGEWERNTKASKELREERRQREKLAKELQRKEKALAELGISKRTYNRWRKIPTII